MPDIDALIVRLEAAEKERDEACSFLREALDEPNVCDVLRMTARAFLARMEVGR